MKTAIKGTVPEYDRLLYRNQFVLGPRFVEGFRHWKRASADWQTHISAHPDLNVARAASNGKSVTLLGFILDPENPGRTDEEILEELLAGFYDFTGLLEATTRLGGRWILVAQYGHEVRLFNDPAGLRQVFFTRPGTTPHTWCASHPGMLAGLLGFETGPEAAEFIGSPEFKSNSEHRWPGYSTPYTEVEHLLPNHWLDVKTGRRERFWPCRELAALTPEAGLERAEAVLKGLLRSAAARFDLALSITAGLDSRLVLAASRGVRHRVNYVTIHKKDMPGDHPDIDIPSGLLSRLALRHQVVRSSPVLHDDFKRAFHLNVDLPHVVYAPDAHAIAAYSGFRKVAVTGSVSEIARCFYREKFPRGREVTAAGLAGLQKMGSHPFALKNFQDWLDGVGDTRNVNVLDLFEWEQGHGNWLAMCQLEFDIAWKDIFTPFNCRGLLEDMLSVPEEHRKPPRHAFYRQLMHRLWPDVLGAPINPHKKRTLYASLRFHLSKTLHRHVRAPLKRFQVALMR